MSRPALPPSVSHLWHRGLAWSLGPLLIGLAAVALARGAESVGAWNQALLAARPWLALLILPGGFMALAWLAARFAPGTQGSGIRAGSRSSAASMARSCGSCRSWRRRRD